MAKRQNKFSLPTKSKKTEKKVEDKVMALKAEGHSKQSAIRIAKATTPGAHK